MIIIGEAHIMKKCVVVSALLLMVIIFTACTTSPDKLPSDIGDFAVYEVSPHNLTETFATENRTYGAFYDDVSLEDASFPKSRVFVIKSQRDMEKIFSDEIDQSTIDYRSEMYVLYTFTTVYRREFLIDSSSVTKEGIVINYSLKSPDSDVPLGDAARPFQRFVLIKMNRVDVENITFIYSD